MNEDQRKWLLDLQSKGIKFEFDKGSLGWVVQQGNFSWFRSDYRIPTQPIPDIPDWRELCRDMRRNGVNVEYENSAGSWIGGHLLTVYGEPLSLPIKSYRIPQQPIPEWREEMTEETKPDPTEEIPHRELQIQWHEDMLHHLRTGEPMREWEYRLKNGDGEWKICYDPHFSEKYEYRRKPKMKTVTYWHCLVKGYGIMAVVHLIESTADALRKHVKSLGYGYEVVGQITETTVEIED